MPIYEYECDKCGHRFERRQGITEDPVKTCPECEGNTRRLIHPVGIVYKTNGFYITDNRPRSRDDSDTKTTTSTTSGSSSSSNSGSSSNSSNSTSKPTSEVAAAKKD